MSKRECKNKKEQHIFFLFWKSYKITGSQLIYLGTLMLNKLQLTLGLISQFIQLRLKLNCFLSA